MEGGIAARTYWLAKALGERGHSIHVVTDRIGIDPLYSVPNDNSGPKLRNVIVRRIPDEGPWIIPSIEQTYLALLNKGFEVIESVEPDIIEGSYLVPYGLVAWVLSKTTGLPLVIRHGGSDIGKFLAKGIWPKLWREVFATAGVVISDWENEACLKKWTEKIKILPPYVPDPDVFTSVGREIKERPILALIGKANYHWRDKGWHRVVDIWAHLKDEFQYLIVCQGRGEKEFRHYAEQKLGKRRIAWQAFVHPWRMPELLRNVDLLFCFERDFPFPTFSNVAIEALYCGVRLVTDRQDFINRYSRLGLTLNEASPLLLSISDMDAKIAAGRIGEFLQRHVGYKSLPVTSDSYLSYVVDNEEVLGSSEF